MQRSIFALIAVVIFASLSLVACQAATPAPVPTPVSTIAPTVVPTAAPVSAPKPTVAPTTAPTVAPTTASAKSLITDLVVNDKATASNWSIASNFQIGDQQFGDRAYTIAKMPTTFAGSDWIRTAMDGKNYTSDPLVTFKVTADVDVYVAYDDRVVTKPAWFKDWVDTSEDIVNTEATPTVFSIFKKSFPANSTVALGQNGQSKTCGQYMIIVRRPGQAAVVATPDPKALASRTCPWDACNTMPAEWYGMSEAIRIADNVLLYQRNTGGWYKNIDMAEPLTDTQKTILLGQKTEIYDSTIDNNATTTQVQYLAKVYAATKQDRFKDGFNKGVDYLLKAQYDNGGWPQYYPVDPHGPASTAYWAHVTFNDNAMINVMTLLRAIAADPAYDFVDKDRRDKAAQAVQKGIALILKTQIVVNGKKMGWCAQYDEKTLAPAQARAYELPSISGQESVPIVRFLMNIDKPSPEVIDAIQSAVKWFESAKITGIEVVDKRDPALPGGLDRVVVQNPNAPAIWARFYDIPTNKPFFVGRDSVKKDTLAEIEQERRIGYAYYTTAPGYLLATEYPAWQKKWVSVASARDAVVDATYSGGEGALVNGVRTYKKIESALKDAPDNATTPYVIAIKNGRYKEQLTITKPFVTLLGESADSTIITNDLVADTKKPDGTTYGTAGSATVAIGASNFRAENLTIENAWDYPANAAKAANDPTKVANTQAVALRTDKGNDRAFFKNVRLLGNQDTLYVNAGTQYFEKCYIAGNVDFIFGAGQAVFNDCDIVSRDRGSPTNNGYVTAPSTLLSDGYGFLFVNSRLKKETPSMADNSVTLGRPWHPTTNLPDGTRAADPSAVGAVMFLNCWMDSHIGAKGWDSMSGKDKDGKTIWFYPYDSRFFEYGTTGPGAVKSDSRRVLSPSEAQKYTIANVLGGWDPSK